MRKGFVHTVVIAAAAVLVGYVPPASASGDPMAGVFEPGPCAPSVAAVSGVRCGFVVVPEDRDHRGGIHVRLAVAVLPALAPTPGALPLEFVNGGPGFDTFSVAHFYATSTLRRTRPIILYDQRGTGLSTPSLACPETAALSYDELGVDAHDAAHLARVRGAVRACHDRLVGSGVHLAAYAGGELAADVVAVPRALGYRHFDIEAVSYGTRTALTVLRTPNTPVRAAVLDSTLPPEADFVGGAFVAAQGALARLFSDCPGGCDGGALRQRFFAIVNRLEQHPVTVTTTVSPGQDVPVRFDGERVAELVTFAVSQPGLFSLIPTLIGLLEAGQYATIAGLLAPQYAPTAQPARGAFLSVQCRDQMPFANRLVPSSFTEGPILASAILARIDELAGECTQWNVPPAHPSTRRPTRTARPILFLQGDLDFTTPLANVEAVLPRLPHAQLVLLRGRGHGVFAFQPDDPCVVGMRNAFLDRPWAPVDRTCLAAA